jgi:hypothetical protein
MADLQPPHFHFYVQYNFEMWLIYVAKWSALETRRMDRIEGTWRLKGAIFSFHNMNFIEPPGKLGKLLSEATLQAPDFSLRSSCAASTERLLETIPYEQRREGAFAYQWLDRSPVRFSAIGTHEDSLLSYSNGDMKTEEALRIQ